MKLIKDKQILVAADKAGFPLKEAVVRHLKQQGWTVTDIGVQSADDPNPEMFHRIGIAAGTKIAEKEFERALLFCGTGMGIHIAASKCPGVMAGVVENLPSALRAITGNNVNCLAIGAYYVAPNLAIDMVIPDILVLFHAVAHLHGNGFGQVLDIVLAQQALQRGFFLGLGVLRGRGFLRGGSRRIVFG